MALTQKYGIKYPFTALDEDNTFMDLNQKLEEGVKSRVLHVIFTPKGQKMRDPEFGTDLIKYIFSQKDEMSFDDIKSEITSQIIKRVPEVEFRDITIYKDENSDNGIIVMVEYVINKGNKNEVTTVAVKL